MKATRMSKPLLLCHVATNECVPKKQKSLPYVKPFFTVLALDLANGKLLLCTKTKIG